MGTNSGTDEKLRILIVRLSSIGDIVHTLPAAGVLRKNYPHSFLEWVVEEPGAPLVEMNRYLDRVIVFPRYRWRKLRRNKEWGVFFRELRSFVHKLGSREYDLVFDLHNILRSGIITGFSRGKTRWGYGSREGNKLFLNRTFSSGWDRRIHPVERNTRALASADLEVADVDFGLPELPLPPEYYGIEPFVIIHPLSRWPSKNWFLLSYRELARKLVQAGYQVVVSGSQTEAQLVEETMQGEEGVTSLAGLISLAEFTALAQKAALFVGGDTGPLHIAAACGTPCVAIMGPTLPEIFGPYGQEQNAITASSLDCLGCQKRKCPHQKCMQKITVDEVLEKSLSILDTGKGILPC